MNVVDQLLVPRNRFRRCFRLGVVNAGCLECLIDLLVICSLDHLRLEVCQVLGEF